MNQKYKCGCCNKIATWMCMSSSKRDIFYCDEHVPRGCSCNVDNIQTLGEPEKEFVNQTIWWSYEDYNECFKKGINPLKYATKERKTDSFYYEILDEQGRRYPCCEYEYSPNGFDK